MAARLIQVAENDWREADKPDDCPRLHGRIGAAWRACALCGKHCRHWPCMADGCGWVKADPEHECRTGPRPPSALRGA